MIKKPDNWKIVKKNFVEVAANKSAEMACVGASLIIPDPVWKSIFLLAIPLINVWGNFGVKRCEEYLDYINKKQNEFDNNVIRTDEFRSFFLSTLERHFKESSKRKRKLFRTVLLNFGSSRNIDYDYSTKILSILDQITFDELKVVNIWSGKLQEALVEKNKTLNYSYKKVEEILSSEGANEHQIYFAFEKDIGKPTLNELVQILRALGNYGLLSIRDTSGVILGDGSEGIHVKITKFGKLFINYINT